MTFNEVLNNGKEVSFLLESNDFEKMSREEAIKLLQHLRDQFKNRYKYLVGDWQGAHRAKNTGNGQFVSSSEVMEYLEN